MAEPLRNLPEIDLTLLLYAGRETLAEVGIGFMLDIAQTQIHEAQERLDDLTDHYVDDTSYDVALQSAQCGLDDAHERLELLLARRDNLESRGINGQLSEFYANLGRACLRHELLQRMADRRR